MCMYIISWFAYISILIQVRGLGALRVFSRSPWLPQGAFLDSADSGSASGSITVSDAHLEAQKYPLGVWKCWKTTPVEAPKWPQSHSNGFRETLQNTWYLWAGRHVRLFLESLGTDFFSASFPSTHSFKFLMTFADLQFKMMSKGESFFHLEWFQMGPFPNKAATRGHNEFQARSRVRKVLPNGVPGSENRVQNGVPGSENRVQNWEVWQILLTTLRRQSWPTLGYRRVRGMRGGLAKLCFMFY